MRFMKPLAILFAVVFASTTYACDTRNNGISMLDASFTYIPVSPVVGQSVQFTDTSTGNPTSWQWAFNDGSASATQNPGHVFSTTGSFAVGLTVANGSGSDSVIQVLSVSPNSTDAHTAASPSMADVRSAINAASPGDTVIVPAGSATWTTEFVVDKFINLIGAGDTKTFITSNYTTSDYLMYLYPSNPSLDGHMRLSGFNFNFANKCAGIHLMVGSGYILHNFRIDHCTLQNGAGNLIGVSGAVYGVADHNTLIQTQRGPQVSDNHNSMWSWWNTNPEYGTANNFYYEDNVMTGPELCTNSGGQGNRYVSRHNTITSTTNNVYWMFDIHGSYDDTLLSTMCTEIYENTINSPGLSVGSLDQRGSMALFYNNTFSCGNVYMQIRNEYGDNVDTMYAPPTSPNGHPKRIHDSYYWNNKNNGTLIYPNIPSQSEPAGGTAYYGSSIGWVPYPDKSFWFQNPNFDGTTNLSRTFYNENIGTVKVAGMGVGLRAARPASCSVEGAGWWATDESKLYRWHNGAWELFYAPYTYPHPLQTR